MTRIPLPQTILEERVVAVARGRGETELAAIIPALEAGGITVVEVTMDSPGVLDSLSRFSAEDRLIGAGTVMSTAETERAIEAGADFIVSPHFDADVVATALAAGIPVIPGAATPSEIVAAWASGASAVKLFPAALGGPDHLRTLRGPLAGIPIIPTGGVTLDSATAYLEAGAVAVGIGGLLTSGDPAVVGARAEKLMRSIRAYLEDQGPA